MSTSLRALYYPYTHIEDSNWLRGTLILFASVNRMLPPGFSGGYPDAWDLEDFVKAGLLGQADLFSPRSFAAQASLAARLKKNIDEDPAFCTRYGREAAELLLTNAQPYGFQINTGPSIALELYSTLMDMRLAWTPSQAPDGPDYIQLHPTVGKVVMSTIAIACAEQDGSQIVGDARSGDLHQALINRDIDQVYDSWLGAKPWPAPSSPSGEQAFEYFVATTADVSQLTATQLAELDREPLTVLINEFTKRVSTLKPMDPGPERQSDFNDIASEVLHAWRTEKRGFARFWREFWSGSGTESVMNVFDRVANSAVPIIAGAGAGVATDQIVRNGLAGFDQTLVASAGSLALGLSMNTFKAYRKARDAAHHSPFRYLSVLGNAGVAFRGAESVAN